MTYFFISLIQGVAPFAILLACAWQGHHSVNGKALSWLALLGFIVGASVRLQLPQVALTHLTVEIFISLSLLLFFVTQWLRLVPLTQFFHVILFLCAGILWAKDPNIAAITSVDVINTDFILHASAVILGLLLCMLISAWLYFLFKQYQPVSQRNFLPYLMSSAIVILVLLPQIADILLNLIKLQLIELTKTRLSFIAKINVIYSYWNYFLVALLSLTLALGYVKIYRLRQASVAQAHNPIEKRQQKALRRDSLRVLLYAAFSVLVVLGTQLYWDKVASLPPQLSTAVPVTLNEKNQIHIPIEQVKDGKLHRFVWVADDGKAVRFFVINRLKEKLSLAVVFDACILCGDQGYVMEGDQVVCIGCGVRMFTPSIGKPGGCNPVPIENWQQTDDEIILSKKSLEEGLNYFSTVLEIEVVDPVDQRKLKNTQTEYRYSYQDKTYFFATEEHLNLFRDNPDRYLQTKEAP
ncbi:DUF2318 domain-containing protein [[Haemophilus] felis]|nr:DUF2318 domain-containing protein [[Haemophilus] felis]